MLRMYRRIFVYAIVLFLFSCGEKKNENKTPVNNSATPADALTEKIKSDPSNPSLYFERAKWNLSMKKFSAATLDVNKALSLDSMKSDFYVLLADINFASLKIHDA